MLSNESNDTVRFHSSKQISTLKGQEVKYMEDIIEMNFIKRNSWKGNSVD